MAESDDQSIPSLEADAKDATQRGLYDGFEAYRTPTNENYRDVLQRGFIVPDTNVFLNFYRYNEQTRNDLFAVLRDLGDRLWVPSQVMEEFWRNRENVLQDPGDVKKTTKDLRKKRDEAVGILHWWINRVGLPADHGTDLDATISESFTKIIDSIGKFADQDASQFVRDTNKDPVLAGLEEILQGRIGTPFEAAEYENACAESKRRADQKRPPGYNDVRNADAGPSGDYLIWVQVLQEAKHRQQDVLVVTGDVKDDWWRKEHGELRGPRPELVEEMKRLTGMTLYMLRPESLLLHARQFLRVKVDDQSVQDIERVAESKRIAGTVKWFDNDKGFGFILSDEGGDVFVHYSEIAGRGYRSLEAGERVAFVIEETDKGPQASNVEILKVSAPRPQPRPGTRPMPYPFGKIRVYELAKEFGVESKDVMAKLQQMGEFVRSASSTIDAPVVRRLREEFGSNQASGADHYSVVRPAYSIPPPPVRPAPSGAQGQQWEIDPYTDPGDSDRDASYF